MQVMGAGRLHIRAATRPDRLSNGKKPAEKPLLYPCPPERAHELLRSAHKGRSQRCGVSSTVQLLKSDGCQHSTYSAGREWMLRTYTVRDTTGYEKSQQGSRGISQRDLMSALTWK